MVKRIRKKTTGNTDFEKRLDAAGIPMLQLETKSGYSYQHIWNAAKGRTAGSPDFWAAMDRAIAEIKAERDAEKKAKKKT